MSSVPINKLVASLMYQYDYNKNGQIDIERRVIGNNRKNESSRFEENHLNGDKVEFSRGDLFKDADKAGIKDKKVTREELENFIGKFDKDGDGFLSSRGVDGMVKGKALGEYELFLRDYEETQLSDGVKKF